MLRTTALRVFSVSKRSFATIFEECSNVQYEKQTGSSSGIAVISLKSPKNKNALSASLVRELNTILDDIYYDSDLRVVILRSLVQGVFCAGATIFFPPIVVKVTVNVFLGADLKERLKMPQRQVFPFVSSLRNLTKRIYNIPVPVIAAIDGAALGLHIFKIKIQSK